MHFEFRGLEVVRMQDQRARAAGDHVAGFEVEINGAVPALGGADSSLDEPEREGGRSEDSCSQASAAATGRTNAWGAPLPICTMTIESVFSTPSAKDGAAVGRPEERFRWEVVPLIRGEERLFEGRATFHGRVDDVAAQVLGIGRPVRRGVARAVLGEIVEEILVGERHLRLWRVKRAKQQPVPIRGNGRFVNVERVVQFR